MNTILNIVRRSGMPVRSATAVLTLPRLRTAYALPVSPNVWRWVSILAIAVALASGVAYVVAVNTILFAGVAMRQDTKTLAAFEQEIQALSSARAAQESPSTLEASARASGMTDAVGIRFLSAGETVALSR